MSASRRRTGVRVATAVATVVVAYAGYQAVTALEQVVSPTSAARSRASQTLQLTPFRTAAQLHDQRSVFTRGSTAAQIERDLASTQVPTPYRVDVADGHAGLSVAHFADARSGGLGATTVTVRMCVHYDVDLVSRSVTPSGETCGPDAPGSESRSGPATHTIAFDPGAEAVAGTDPYTGAGPDLGTPPHYGDNNAWKQRRALSAADEASANAAATRLLAALEEQRRSGSVDEAATGATVRRLGHQSGDTALRPMRASTGTPAGTVVAIHVGDTACLIADVRRERVDVSVVGRNAEFDFACLEPFTH